MSNDFLKTGEEEYQDIPQGGGGFGFIGHVKSVQRWDCGWLAEDTTLNGKEYKRGRIYSDGSREDAEDLTKELGGEFVSRVMMLSCPVSSVTNMDNDNKAKFTSGVIQGAARIVGLGSQKYGAGLNLCTVPSLVDAYARAKGWYEKPLFDPVALAGIDKVEDAGYVIDSLVKMREAIWAALGEVDHTKTFGRNPDDPKGTKSTKLREALDKTYMHSWESWVRVQMAFDPSPKAFYISKEDSSSNRQRVPVVIEFFPGEKAAIEAGKKELAGRGVSAGDTIKNGGVVDFAALYERLSDKAKATYDVDTWMVVGESVVDDLRVGKSLTVVAKDYDIDIKDAKAVKDVL